MSFCNFSTESVINDKVEIDNIFINDYLPIAPESTIKVYLFGLYMCSHATSSDNTIESFSRTLNLSEQDVLDCFLYWQEKGLVKVLSTYPIQIKYMPVKNAIDGTKKFNKEKYSSFNLQAQEIIKGRMLTPNEYIEYYTLLEAFHIEQEALLMIMSYCTKLKGENIGYSYIITVAKNWASEGITTASAVEERLKEFEKQSDEMKELFKKLGTTKKPNIDDHEMFIKWTEKLGFTYGTILYVAQEQKRKRKHFSIEQLDSLLQKYYEMKTMSTQEIDDFENKKESLKELAININKSLGLYYESLDNIIESYITPWVNHGYDAETLLAISTYCFKKSIRSLEGMNKIVLKLFKLGILTKEAIKEHINSLNAVDQEIREILEKLGMQRNVNTFDREMYATWTNTWGTPKELFDYGISQSQGKSQPLQYFSKLLSIWHDKNIKTVENAQKCLSITIPNTSAQAKLEGHSYTSEQLNALFDSLEEIEI